MTFGFCFCNVTTRLAGSANLQISTAAAGGAKRLRRTGRANFRISTAATGGVKRLRRFELIWRLALPGAASGEKQLRRPGRANRKT